MAQRNQRGMTTVRAPVFRQEPLNLTVPSRRLEAAGSNLAARDVAAELWAYFEGFLERIERDRGRTY